MRRRFVMKTARWADMRLVNRMLYRADDESASTMAFVEAMLDVVAKADMSLYWSR